MSNNSEQKGIVPGRYYTPETLPPLSPKAQGMLDRLDEVAPLKSKTKDRLTNQELEELVPDSEAAKILRRMPLEDRLPLLRNQSTLNPDTPDLSEEVKEAIRGIGRK